MHHACLASIVFDSKCNQDSRRRIAEKFADALAQIIEKFFHFLTTSVSLEISYTKGNQRSRNYEVMRLFG